MVASAVIPLQASLSLPQTVPKSLPSSLPVTEGLATQLKLLTMQEQRSLLGDGGSFTLAFQVELVGQVLRAVLVGL